MGTCISSKPKSTFYNVSYNGYNMGYMSADTISLVIASKYGCINGALNVSTYTDGKKSAEIVGKFEDVTATLMNTILSDNNDELLNNVSTVYEDRGNFLMCSRLSIDPLYLCYKANEYDNIYKYYGDYKAMKHAFIQLAKESGDEPYTVLAYREGMFMYKYTCDKSELNDYFGTAHAV